MKLSIACVPYSFSEGKNVEGLDIFHIITYNQLHQDFALQHLLFLLLIWISSNSYDLLLCYVEI